MDTDNPVPASNDKPPGNSGPASEASPQHKTETHPANNPSVFREYLDDAFVLTVSKSRRKDREAAWDVENATRFPHPHTPDYDYGQISNKALH